MWQQLFEELPDCQADIIACRRLQELLARRRLVYHGPGVVRGDLTLEDIQTLLQDCGGLEFLAEAIQRLQQHYQSVKAVWKVAVRLPARPAPDVCFI